MLGAYSIHLLFSEHTVYVCFDFESFCCCNFSGATLTEMFSNENNAPLLLRGRSIKTGILCIYSLCKIHVHSVCKIDVYSVCKIRLHSVCKIKLVLCIWIFAKCWAVINVSFWISVGCQLSWLGWYAMQCTNCFQKMHHNNAMQKRRRALAKFDNEFNNEFNNEESQFLVEFGVCWQYKL